MRTLKSLNQAYKLSKNQLTAQNLINGQIYTSRGWETFNLTDDFKLFLARSISELLGGWGSTRNAVFNSIYYGCPQHWGLSRILIEKYKNHKDKRKNVISLNYCAGQDYTWELNTIRQALK